MPNIKMNYGDSLEAMKSMQDLSYDLAIVDPPYGLGEDGKKNHSRGNLIKAKKYTPKSWDRSIPSIKYFEELIRVSKNQIIFGINYFAHYGLFKEGRLLWDKMSGGSYNSDGELLYQSFTKSLGIYKYRWNGMLQGDMKNKQIRIHPTEKPVAIYKYLLKKYAKEGDKILDTHGGSMSIAIACWDLGFDLDIWEKDEEYFRLAKNRFELHKASNYGLFRDQKIKESTSQHQIQIQL